MPMMAGKQHKSFPCSASAGVKICKYKQYSVLQTFLCQREYVDGTGESQHKGKQCVAVITNAANTA